MRHIAQPDEVASLGEYLKRLRQEAGLSQSQLARDTGISQAIINRVESGEIAQPNPDKLTRLADALGVPSANFFGLAGYAIAGDLPTLPVYLRTKYGETLSVQDRRDLQDWLTKRTNRVNNQDQVEGGHHENNSNQPSPRRST